MPAPPGWPEVGKDARTWRDCSSAPTRAQEWDGVSPDLKGKSNERLAYAAQTLGTILTRASCTALSRSTSISGSWYGMARMR
jgi:hypothetical protein